MDKIYKITVAYSSYGEMYLEAESQEDARAKAQRLLDQGTEQTIPDLYNSDSGIDDVEALYQPEQDQIRAGRIYYREIAGNLKVNTDELEAQDWQNI